MEQICLDTNAVIELVRGNKEVIAQFNEFSIFYLSIISVYEYGRGKLTLEQVEEDLEKFNFITINYKIIIKAIEIYKDLIKKGELIDDNDIIIGACCIVNNIPLLTLNKKHFDKLKKFGLKIVWGFRGFLLRNRKNLDYFIKFSSPLKIAGDKANPIKVVAWYKIRPSSLNSLLKFGSL